MNLGWVNCCGLGLQALPDVADPGFKGGEVAGVGEDEVGSGGLFCIGHLAGEAGTGVGFGGGAGSGILGLSGGDAVSVAGDLEVVGGGEDQDAIEAIAPVGEQVERSGECSEDRPAETT